MAKRKRLSPAQSAYLPVTQQEASQALLAAKGVGGAGAPPIAQVARDATVSAALEEVSAELSLARSEGRLIQSLPLSEIDRNYLMRDRIVLGNDEMETLKASLTARGQQTPIDVVEIGQGQYGLISGWRRLTALEVLYRETGAARFATVQALLRQPENAGEAYTAMVEENEVRVGLSPFERARIVRKAVEQGAFANESAALRAIFSTSSRAKRSKIGSFLRIVTALEDDLRFPGAIAERLGLRMAKALEMSPEFETCLRVELQRTPPVTLEAELALIDAALRSTAPVATGDKRTPQPSEQKAAMKVVRKGQRIILSGPNVTEEFETNLRDWLINKCL